jgi:protein LTV1
MGKKKTAFIDKNNSSTYHLLHRSQRDVGGDGSGVVLWPNPDNSKETDDKVLLNNPTTGVLAQWKEEMQQVGLVDDYDYEKHMMPITGSGDFFANDGHRANALVDPRAVAKEDHEIKEIERQLDSIALTPDCMDSDVAQVLFGEFDDGDFEEILDDFVFTAAQEPTEQEEKEAFDFDAHIQQLMEKARLQKEEKGIEAEEHDWGRHDQAFFSKGKALNKHEERDDESYDYDDDDFEGAAPGIVPALNPDEEKALCDKFEQTLLEYDSDEVGDLEEDCRYIGGELQLEGDKHVEAALDQYLVERDDGMFMEAPEYHKGSGFFTLKVPGNDQPEKFAEVMAEATDFLRTPELDLPPEEILIDGQSYFSQTSRNPWDCESVLSTYSNLDNNPVTIDGGRRRGKKKKKQISAQPVVEEEEEEEHVQIRLSNKTGLPLGVLPTKEKGDDFDFDTIASVNKGEKRSKTESVNQKKVRKQQIKQERQVARIQKKMMKEAFAAEFVKADGATDDMAGKTVFKF